MVARIELTTDPTQEHAPLLVEDVSALVISKGGRYNLWTVKRIVEAVNKWCKVYLISPRVVMAQILHETGWFKFGGDVYWWQFNFAGIGATGRVIGHMFTKFAGASRTFIFAPTHASSQLRDWIVRDEDIDWLPSIDLGVLVVVQHHAAYLYGRKENWPYSAAHLDIVDPRYQIVLDKNLGDSVMNVQQYGGKWAYPGTNYGNMIVQIANTLPVEEGIMPTVRPYVMTIPLRVSHIPWNNPNRSRQLSLPSGRGYITVHETGNPKRGANAEMHRVFVHNGGGTGNVSFTYVVDDKEVIELVPRGEKTWQASDGTNGPGNSSVSIETCVNSDGDWTKTLNNLNELLLYLTTNDPNLSPHRVVQHNHWAPDGKNCPTIMRGNNGRGWQDLLAKLRFDYGTQLSPVAPPTPPQDPNALEVNGIWIINEIYHKWKSLGENTLPVFGYPLAGMRRYTIDGVERDGQLFERGVLAVYEEGTPDGVPKGHPFRVRMLTLQEQEAVVAYAIDEGEIEPFE